MDSLKAAGKEVKSRIASRPLSEEGASTLGSELGAPPGSEKITPKRSILEPNVEIGLKSAIGVRGRISTATLREIQLRETSTFSIHSNSSNLREICRDESMPGDATVREWAVDDREGFSAQYTRAIRVRAMLWAEEITGIADDGSNDTYIDPNTGQEKLNAEVVARSRLRVDTRKWMLSKVLPKVYGDKLDVNHGVQPENPLAKLLEQIQGTPLRPKGD